MQEQEQELTQSQAVGLLIQAADVAQSRGAFKLEEASVITRAIHLLAPGRQSLANATNPVDDSPSQEGDDE